MDVLLIEPPYKSLKGVSLDCGYVMSLVSLAAYLRAAGIEAQVLSADLLLDLPPQNAVEIDLVRYARGQDQYEYAVLQDDHPVWRDLAAVVRKARPRAVGVTYMTPVKYAVARVAEVVKAVDPEIPVILGGHHPTFCADEVLADPNVDFVVRGEGEVPFLALIRQLLAGRRGWESVPGLTYREPGGDIRSTAEPPLLADLDALPFPARDAVIGCNFRRYRTHFAATARGCPSRCAFCCDRTLWHRKVRRRSVGNVLEELKELKATYDVSYVDVTDGTFTYDPSYVRAFCERMIAEDLGIRWRCTARFDGLDAGLLRLMRKANCSALYFGLESGSRRILDSIHKGTNLEEIRRVGRMVRDSGLVSMVSVLVGLPDETDADVQDTLALMRSLTADLFDVNTYIPLPGTHLYDALDEETRRSIDWRKMGYKSLVGRFSPHIPEPRLRELVLEAHAVAEESKRRFRRRLPRLAAAEAASRVWALTRRLLPRRPRPADEG
ncbi:MAG: radical SAM protein [Deltaproteobacteria bacterium]|nr:radical SAM protein [Deltaproteobacteria bacterium]